MEGPHLSGRRAAGSGSASTRDRWIGEICLQGAQQKQEDTMHTLTARVLPVIIAASLSALTFTATLY